MLFFQNSECGREIAEGTFEVLMGATKAWVVVSESAAGGFPVTEYWFLEEEKSLVAASGVTGLVFLYQGRKDTPDATESNSVSNLINWFLNQSSFKNKISNFTPTVAYVHTVNVPPASC